MDEFFAFIQLGFEETVSKKSIKEIKQLLLEHGYYEVDINEGYFDEEFFIAYDYLIANGYTLIEEY